MSARRPLGAVPGAARGPRPRTSDERGQSLVEFAVIVPVFMLLLLAMLEFGFAFEHDQTIAYATREGARTGAALGDGSTTYPCTTADFDAPIIAAVERVLTAPGSPIDLSQVSSISVYKSKADGSPTAGYVNVWTPASSGTPVVDGKALDFKQTTTGWIPCNRNNSANADALGVSINYTYEFRTTFGGIFRFLFGKSWSSIPISDKTVMNLNPTN